jgi:hypothetical protein
MEAYEHYNTNLKKLLKFSVLFDYETESERSVAIVGPAYLDSLMQEILANFMVEDQNRKNI